MKSLKDIAIRSAVAFGVLLLLCVGGISQSTDSSFPTPVTTTEINGVIKARDIGDSRLTTYFYEFDGGQGDIFINVVTKNLSGDIDVYTADGLRPLTKVVIYADIGTSETGRLVYLRKPERLILRVEGRTPGDEAATFRIRFAGSFIAMKPVKAEKEPVVDADVKAEDRGIRVNSVGTILPSDPKPVPPKKVDVEKPKAEKTVAEKPKEKEKKESTKKPVVVVEDFPSETKKIETSKKESDTAKTTGKRQPKPKKVDDPAKVEEPKVDPLASIKLIVQMKDGAVIESPMSEVLKFSVDKGVLTVIMKGGKITRYSILVVAKVTIE
ncbi:MAG: hypothetical protein ABL952_10585 [Pyrinomonadaceae bacterium]